MRSHPKFSWFKVGLIFTRLTILDWYIHFLLA
jgi:hypothetical protein